MVSPKCSEVTLVDVPPERLQAENGAKVGDLFMRLIYTVELNKLDPFDYLVELWRHQSTISADPGRWMPWNYRATLPRSGCGTDPPA